VRRYGVIARDMGVHVMVVRVIYVIVLRAGACASIVPLVITGALDRFQLSFDLVGLYYCA
jgi:hypothetical protein